MLYGDNIQYIQYSPSLRQLREIKLQRATVRTIIIFLQMILIS